MWYVIGAILGGIVMSFCGIWSFYFYIKRRIYNSLIAKIKADFKDQVKSDIKLWALHTKNYFVDGNIYLDPITNAPFLIDGLIFTPQAILVLSYYKIKGSVSGKNNDNSWIQNFDDKTKAIPNLIKEDNLKINIIKQMTQVDVPILNLIVFSNWLETINIKDKPNNVILTRHIGLFHALDKITLLEQTISYYKLKILMKKVKSYKASFNQKQIYYETRNR